MFIRWKKMLTGRDYMRHTLLFIGRGLDFANTFSDNPWWVSLPGKAIALQWQGEAIFFLFLGGEGGYHILELNLIWWRAATTTNTERQNLKSATSECVCHAAERATPAAFGWRRSDQRERERGLSRLLRHCGLMLKEGRDTGVRRGEEGWAATPPDLSEAFFLER